MIRFYLLNKNCVYEFYSIVMKRIIKIVFWCLCFLHMENGIFCASNTSVESKRLIAPPNITVRKFLDVNLNGVYDTGDTPMAGVVFQIYDLDDNSLVTEITTDNQGWAYFSPVGPPSGWDANYKVVEIVPPGTVPVIPQSGEMILPISYNFTIFLNRPITEGDCCNSFQLLPQGRYWISAWVKEDHPTQVKKYNDAFLELEFTGSGVPSPQFYTSGEIIDGWQRIVGEFYMPATATHFKIHLVNQNTQLKAYFDDIRVHPFNASMKSYVYDPVTLWLTAELDDNNYATFYEYDNEGQLIRIKKETERGIMTIQESRSSNPKKGL